MSYSPIAKIAPQYENYTGWWLKCFEQGTTSPIPMSLDAAGSTTVAKLQIDNSGFLNTTGGARVIPYLDEPYDAWLIPTEAEADADDVGNGVIVADNISSSDPNVSQNKIDIATNASGITTNAAGIATNAANIATNTADIAAIPFSGSYLSSPITMTSGGLVTLAHGLGEEPKIIHPYIECVVASAGWSVGDKVAVSFNSSTAAAARMNSFYFDSTNIYIRFSNYTSAFIVGNKSTGVFVDAGHNNWELYVRAFA